MKSFALVDCNNFYASCEKLFRPDLKHTPVVVLSNNDGCVVARSKEVKQLGIKMGVPYFKLKSEVAQYGIVAFSSNYALYADISNRVMTTLEMLAPKVEVYSIDEAFLDLTGVDHCREISSFGQQLRQTIYQWVGISVGVGIAPTKTLAKLANHAAKIYPTTQGVVDLTDRTRQRKLMAITPVSEVWGVGRQLSKHLTAIGVDTALKLADINPGWIKKQFNVVLERTVRELNGQSCLKLDDVTPIKKQIISSRSFGERITEKHVMREAIGSYAARATEKLRQQNQFARSLTVFIRTNPFSNTEPYYSNSATYQFPIPTDDTRDMLEKSHLLLDSIWRTGYRYMKGGVMLNDFYDAGIYQPDLFCEQKIRTNSKPLMQVLDKINHSGKGNIWFAGEGITKAWGMKREHLSPAYTTNWKDLPVVK
jgi:DNA polymerase V